MLNDRLSTAFVLRDPDLADVIDETDKLAIPLSLQRKILLPFGQVKGLYSMEVAGFDASIERSLRTAMAVPPPTLQQSCESATTLLREGDAHLSRGAAGAPLALASYTAAFHAIHILISGRTRRVLADTFFHANISRGLYAGQTGMTVRVILRLKLVSRMIGAFLTLKRWDDALFWGMRSVRIMAEAMDTEFEDFLAELVGGDDVALVYIRAAVALWKMRADSERWEAELEEYDLEETADVERLLQASQKHLKRGKAGARHEVERYGLPRVFVGLFDEPDVAESDDGSTAVQVDSADQGGSWF